MSNLGQYIRSFRKSLFRLQARAVYSVGGEDEKNYRRFREGQVSLDVGDDGREWLRTIKGMTSEGRRWTNVQVLPSRLTPYLRYALQFGYVHYHASGAAVRFLLHSAPGDVLSLANKDFYVFDDKTVILMEYDESGEFLGSEQMVSAAEIARYLSIRDQVLRYSVDFEHVLSLTRLGRLL